jgi:hypothetical protein
MEPSMEVCTILSSPFVRARIPTMASTASTISCVMPPSRNQGNREGLTSKRRIQQSSERLSQLHRTLLRRISQQTREGYDGDEADDEVGSRPPVEEVRDEGKGNGDEDDVDVGSKEEVSDRLCKRGFLFVQAILWVRGVGGAQVGRRGSNCGGRNGRAGVRVGQLHGLVSGYTMHISWISYVVAVGWPIGGVDQEARSFVWVLWIADQLGRGSCTRVIVSCGTMQCLECTDPWLERVVRGRKREERKQRSLGAVERSLTSSPHLVTTRTNSRRRSTEQRKFTSLSHGSAHSGSYDAQLA